MERAGLGEAYEQLGIRYRAGKAGDVVSLEPTRTNLRFSRNDYRFAWNST